MRVPNVLILASITLLPPTIAPAEDLDCKKIAWHAQLVMTIRQMDADINKALEDITKEGWPFGREMLLEAYDLPIVPPEERKRRLSTSSKSFGNEWGRRCLAGELD